MNAYTICVQMAPPVMTSLTATNVCAHQESREVYVIQVSITSLTTVGLFILQKDCLLLVFFLFT